jgi:hypothetical protein
MVTRAEIGQHVWKSAGTSIDYQLPAVAFSERHVNVNMYNLQTFRRSIISISIRRLIMTMTMVLVLRAHISLAVNSCICIQ